MSKAINPLSVLSDYTAKFKTQREAAGSLGITAQYLSDMLQGRRDVSETILGKLGFRTVRTIMKEPRP